AELSQKAERGKQGLGHQRSAKVAMNFGGKPRIVEVAQAEFEKACSPFWKHVTGLMDAVMKRQGKQYADLDRLVLAGAPLHSPRAQKLIADHTGLQPTIAIDPAFIVVSGAAMLGRNASGNGHSIGHTLKQATTHPIGITVMKEATRE